VLALTVAALAAGEPERSYREKGIRPAAAVLWHNPGAVERLDLRYGAGGRALVPRPPFTFLKEDDTGTNAKVKVRDANGREWAVKFGPEASPDTFGSRMAWAMGYYAETNYYVARGTIRGAHNLKRADKFIDDTGRFDGARFQLRGRHPEYVAGVSWAWTDNPFLGTPQLHGLKILCMLLSNWDDKDIRDAEKRGSNTAIFKNGARYEFFIDDWGGSMGNWGKYFTRTKWDTVDYYRQSEKFVRGIKNGEVEWGYHGTHSDQVRDGIHVSDVRWLLRYLGRLSDPQIHAGLMASGATEDEAYFYTRALRFRIRELQEVVRLEARARQLEAKR
jgi:hypothetical protein